MLIKSLRNCFSASKHFAKFAVRLLLEKLNSSVEEAQLDSLETFTQCAQTSYIPNDYHDYIESLWNSFHSLVVNANKSNIGEAAIQSIQALSQSISSSIQTSTDNVNFKSNFVSIEWFVQKAFDSCLPSLNEMEPDLKLVWPNVKCLEAIASSSSTANLLVINKVITLVLDKLNSSSLTSHKKTFLEIALSFVNGTLKFNKKGSINVYFGLLSLIL
jgi:DNA repair/transcription protein MET18/MMS19